MVAHFRAGFLVALVVGLFGGLTGCVTMMQRKYNAEIDLARLRGKVEGLLTCQEIVQAQKDLMGLNRPDPFIQP